MKGASALLLAGVLCAVATASCRSAPPARIYERAQLERARERAEGAVARNQLANGLFEYELSQLGGSEDNDVRQLLVTRYLAEAARTRPASLALHQRNLAGVLTAWYREAGDEGYVWFLGHSKLGSNGLLLSALALSPLFEQHRAQAEKLAAGVLGMVRDDGSLSPWYRQPSPPQDDEMWSRYAVGEAMLGLLDLYDRSRAPRLLAAVTRVEAHYVTHFVVEIAHNYHPACVPWQVGVLARLHALSHRRGDAEAAFVLVDRLLELQNTDPAQTEYLGRFYDPRHAEYGRPHASADAVYTEAVTMGLELAIAVGDPTRQRRYGEALRLAVQNLLRLQIPEGDDRLPPRAAGALRTNVDEGQARARIDSTQHAIDAWTRLLRLDDAVVTLPR